MDRNNTKSTEWVEKYAHLLDSQFRIPFTNITFGIDPILSFIPGLGTFSGLILGSILIVVSSKKGVSAQTRAKMIRNLMIDFVIGLIPIVGTIKDFFFKANERNYKLLEENIHEGKHDGKVTEVVTSSIKATICIVMIFVILSFVVGVYLISLLF